MANIAQYKNIVKEMEGRIELLSKAIELNPQETITYQTAIQYCEQQLEASKAIISADEIVNKAEPGTGTTTAPTSAQDDKPAKKKPSKKKAEPKPAEEPAPAVEEQTNIFDMFGD